MALYFVNDHLIQEEIVGDGTWPSAETYKRYMIRSANFLKKGDGNSMEEQSRPICAHNCSDSVGANTRISTVIHEGARSPKITVRTSCDTRYDSDIFVVAIPYDGLIKPVVHDEKALSIFKCVMIKSDKMSIQHEDRKYKRVAYFVVRPDYNYLGEDGKYAPDCDLVVTFAQSNRISRNQAESDSHWTFKTVRVSFGSNGIYDITSTEETAPYDTFNPDDVKGSPICSLVEPILIKDDDNAPKQNGKRK